MNPASSKHLNMELAEPVNFLFQVSEFQGVSRQGLKEVLKTEEETARGQEIVPEPPRGKCVNALRAVSRLAVPSGLFCSKECLFILSA